LGILRYGQFAECISSIQVLSWPTLLSFRDQAHSGWYAIDWGAFFSNFISQIFNQRQYEEPWQKKKSGNYFKFQKVLN
jgi:hypothetical protein